MDLVEARVRAANGRFAGVADCCVAPGDLPTFAAQLRGFPASAEDRRELEVGDRARLTFRRLDSLGHAIVDVRLANADGESVVLLVPVEPAAVDAFVGELERIQQIDGAVACLRQAT